MANKKMTIGIYKITEANSEGYVEKEPVLIESDEYPNIYLDHTVEKDEFENALNTVITACMQNNMHTLDIDLDTRNNPETENIMSEPVEMSIEEIEQLLGHPIKIISKGEKT